MSSFDELASVCENIANHSSRLSKVSILASYLKQLDDDELILAVRFLSSGPIAAEPGNHTLFEMEPVVRLSIGSSTLRDALLAVTDWDRETVRICYAEVGDMGELTSLLLRSSSNAGSRPLSLAEADQIYQQLFQARTAARKQQILTDTYRTFCPLTLKYWIKIITRGLRIGLMAKQVEESLASACGVPLSAVRDASNRGGDLAQVAVAARHGKLETIEARLFHPMEFMLAKPLERLEDLADPAQWFVEDKYDGIRSQIHFANGRVEIYGRGLEEVTKQFPEIEAAARNLPGNGLIDGELLAYRDGRALNFNVLQQRLARKQVRLALQQEIPVVFVAYDLLLLNDRLLFETAIEERRSLLAELFSELPSPLLIAPQSAALSLENIDRSFLDARAQGNEGLILKRRGSHYEPSRRSGTWLKVKRPYGTLDVVITSAEQGSGRRAIFFSDYTFAVRDGERFLNVGKAYSGLTDSEVKELTKVLRAASLDRFGPVMIVRPEVVLEVAFDGVQKSSHHKSGYALRFPRILRWRRDKSASDADSLSRVQELYQASLRIPAATIDKPSEYSDPK